MKKVTKSSVENALTVFASNHPTADWDDFRNSGAYTEFKSLVFQEQFYLCAYCEVDLSDVGSHNQRIEHFNSKSSVGGLVNLHLDWFNILGVCIGGSDRDSRTEFSLPANLSCDSHKAHLEKKNPSHWDGKVVSPLLLPDDMSLFNFKKGTWELLPDYTNCQQVTFEKNCFPTTHELVQETINVFNLNCDRLTKARSKLFHEYQNRLRNYRQTGNKAILENLVLTWSGNPPRSFQTVRDSIVREASLIINKL